MLALENTYIFFTSDNGYHLEKQIAEIDQEYRTRVRALLAVDEVSKSGDMAYVVTEATGTRQLKDGKTENVNNATLVVLKKENTGLQQQRSPSPSHLRPSSSYAARGFRQRRVFSRRWTSNSPTASPPSARSMHSALGVAGVSRVGVTT